MEWCFVAKRLILIVYPLSQPNLNRIKKNYTYRIVLFYPWNESANQYQFNIFYNLLLSYYEQ